MKFYVVIDTNVIISSLFEKNIDSAVKIFIDSYLLKSNNLIPIYNKEIFNEYINVLNRDKFNEKFSRIEAINLLSFIQKNGINIETKKDYINLLNDDVKKSLTDPKDFIFYNITMESKMVLSKNSSFLVSGNVAHFPTKVFIKTPKQMIDYIEEVNKKVEMYEAIFHEILNNDYNEKLDYTKQKEEEKTLNNSLNNSNVYDSKILIKSINTDYKNNNDLKDLIKNSSNIIKQKYIKEKSLIQDFRPKIKTKDKSL